MTEAEIKAKADAEAAEKAKADAARADAEPPAWAKSLADAVAGCMSKVDSALSRMDSMESLIKCDAEEEEEKKREDKARKDAEEAEAKEREDKARKDAEDEEERKREDAAKADAARADSVKKLEATVAEQAAMLKALTGAVHISDADRAELSNIQARADGVAIEFGTKAPQPMAGETPIAYRRRLAAQYQPHSTQWKGVDLAGIADSALHIAEDAIYSDAVKVAQTAPEVPAGTLREIRRKDRTGREIIEFQGSMNAWMGQFKAPGMKQVSITNGSK